MANLEPKREESYWADKDGEELVGCLVERRKDFAQMLEQTGVLERISRTWEYFSGIYASNDGQTNMAIKRTGDEEGGALANINHTKALVDKYVTYVVSNRPAWDARAINNDFKARNEAILFNDLLDAYMEIGGMDEGIRRSATHAMVLSAGFAYLSWDLNRGDALRPDEGGNLLYEGDLRLETPLVFDVSWDYTVPDFSEVPWVQVRTIRNRWDLIKLYSKSREDLIEAPPVGKKDSEDDYRAVGAIGLNGELTDQIEVFEFWHKQTPAMPEGRHVSYIADKVLLLDEPNPYKILPVARLIPSEFILTCLGYTPAFDAQVAQEWYGSALSTHLSNLNQLGQPKIFVPRNAGVNKEDFEPGSGVPVIEFDGQMPPFVADFTAKLEDHTKTLDYAKGEMGLVMGIGPVSQGVPQGELKGASGAAFALLDSKSIESTNVFGQREREFLARIGTIALKICQTKANTKRLTALVGRENRSRMKEWSAEDISSVDRVIVETGSPLQRSIAGKVQIADALREQGWLSTPQEYLTVIETGQVKPLTDAMDAQLNTIADENQRLRDNYEVADKLIQAMEFALMAGNFDLQTKIAQYLQEIGVVCLDSVDNHILHFRRHASILDSSEVRMIRGIVVPVTAHLQQHLMAILNPAIQQQQILMGYITGQQLQEFMAATRLLMPPSPAAPGGGNGMPEGNAAPGQLTGTMNANPPSETTPRPMSETGRAPQAPRISPKAPKGPGGMNG